MYTKKDLEFQRFRNLFLQCNKTKDNLLLNDILSFECDDYRVHFFKAVRLRQLGETKRACEEIEYCLRSRSNVISQSKGLDSGKDNDMYFVDDNGVPQIIVHDQDIYSLAGELYAQQGDAQKSQEIYKASHLRTFPESDDFTSLFSFRRFNEYSLSDIINEEITVCHPSQFNDPFDSLVIPWIMNNDRDYAEKTHVPPMQKSYDYFRVRAFAEDADIKAVSNTLMWSHYAQDHKGFCLEYEFDKGFTQTDDDSLYVFKRINYEEENKQIDLSGKKIDNKMAFYTKQNQWKYENEVRLITYLPHVESPFAHIPMGDKCRIKAVYFGIHCPEEHIKTLIRVLANKTDVQYYRMTSQINDIYSLKPVPLHTSL